MLEILKECYNIVDVLEQLLEILLNNPRSAFKLPQKTGVERSQLSVMKYVCVCISYTSSMTFKSI